MFSGKPKILPGSVSVLKRWGKYLTWCGREFKTWNCVDPFIQIDYYWGYTWWFYLSCSSSTCFLRLLEKVCDDCVVEVDETGKLTELPLFSFIYGYWVWIIMAINLSCYCWQAQNWSSIMGGRHSVHDCGVNRSICYFLEPWLCSGCLERNHSPLGLKVMFIFPFSCTFNLFH